MFTEQLKTEILELLNRWTSPACESPGIRPLVSKSEFLEIMQDVIKITFEVDVNLSSIKTSQNETILLDPKTLEKSFLYEEAKIDDYSQNLNQSKGFLSLDTLSVTNDYRCEEVCRSDEKVNTTVSIDDALDTEQKLGNINIKTDTSPVFINEVGMSDTFKVEDSENCSKSLADTQAEREEFVDGNCFNTKNLDDLLENMEIKMNTSPVVFINEVGRSDTFEVEGSANCSKLLADTQKEREEVVDGNWFNTKKQEDMIKKLEKALSDISGIAKATSTIAKDVTGIKKQFQEEVNRLSLPKRRNSKSPLIAVTPIKINTPNSKLSSSMRRKSTSFTTDQNRNKLTASSPNRSISTCSLAISQKSLISCTQSPDPVENKVRTKNLKYAHIQSTIPKCSSIRKQIPK